MPPTDIPAVLIEAELAKILSSTAFTKADRSSRFLRFVVQQHLQGKASEIKEYVVGTEVFGKNADFDPRTDAIVRAEANRLRARLDQYYSSEGKYDSIRISVPRGSYVPRIEQNSANTCDTPVITEAVSRSYVPLLCVVGAVVISGLLLWRFLPGRAFDGGPISTPLTSYPGRVASPSFSPDGNQVAFAWRPSPESHSGIYTKLIGVDQPLQLTADAADDYAPAWAPDGQSVAFLRMLSRDRDGVFLVPAIGGRARKVAEIFPTGLSDCYAAWQPAWHPGGRWLIVADKDSAGGPFRLFAVSAITGQRRSLTSPSPKSVGDLYPAISPNGRTLAFTRSIANNVSDLYQLPISDDLTATGEPKRLSTENFYVGSSAWTPDGRAIVFSGGDFHNPSLWKIGVEPPSGKPSRLGFAAEGVTTPTISRQGRLAYGRGSIDVDIWRMDLTHPSHLASKLISSTRLDHTPQFSPDGKRIAFASNRSGSHELWIANNDGSKPVQVTFVGGFNYRADPHWSADGQRLYFSYFDQGGQECWVVSSDGGSPSRVSIASEGCPTAWSPDRAWMYFTRDGQVWKMRSNGGSSVPVTRGGGTAPLPSVDGKWLYFRKTDDEVTSLWRVPVDGGSETRVIESVFADNVAVTPRGIYFVSNPDHPSIQFLNFGTRKIELVAPIAHMPSWGFSISPDGRTLLYTTYEALLIHDLMLVEKFSPAQTPVARFRTLIARTLR